MNKQNIRAVKKYRANLKAQGFKRLDIYVPEELAQRVLNYKNSLLQYRKIQLSIQ